MPGSRFRTARAGRGSGRSSSPQPARATADVLQANQFGIQGAILHEFMMGTRSDYTAIVYDDDPISVENGGQTMRAMTITARRVFARTMMS